MSEIGLLRDAQEFWSPISWKRQSRAAGVAACKLISSLNRKWALLDLTATGGRVSALNESIYVSAGIDLFPSLPGRISVIEACPRSAGPAVGRVAESRGGSSPGSSVPPAAMQGNFGSNSLPIRTVHTVPHILRTYIGQEYVPYSPNDQGRAVFWHAAGLARSLTSLGGGLFHEAMHE